MRDAEEYTISVRLESIDDERIYVARVEELPDVEEYADSYEFARTLALDTIRTTQRVFAKRGMEFPEPRKFATHSSPQASGRVTVRLAKSLHAQCIQRAEEEGISLNSYVSNALVHYNSSIFGNHIDIATVASVFSGMTTLLRHRTLIPVITADHNSFAYEKVRHLTNIRLNDHENNNNWMVEPDSRFKSLRLKIADVSHDLVCNS